MIIFRKLLGRPLAIWMPVPWLFCQGNILSAQSKMPLRWAIISNLSPDNAKAADLLNVRLAKRSDLQLVERDNVDAAVCEAGLQAIMEPKSATQRVQLGKRLAADVLIVLDEIAVPAIGEAQQAAATTELVNPPVRAATPAVRVVICDVNSGARLSIETVARKTRPSKN